MAYHWDEDLDKLFANADLTPVDGKLTFSVGEISELLAGAWQYGYTTGMADSGRLEAQLTRAQGGIYTTDRTPVTITLLNGERLEGWALDWTGGYSIAFQDLDGRQRDIRGNEIDKVYIREG